MPTQHYALAAKYIAQLESVPCNACGSMDIVLVCERERFGLPLRTVICRSCALLFIDPRPTKKMYAEFYRSDYRKVVSGSDEGDAIKFKEQVGFAQRIILPLLERYAPDFAPKNILDLGCSYGGILFALMERFPGSSGFGLEPLVKISEYARQRTGAAVYTTLLEDFEPEQQFDLIVFPRSLNHSLDPLANLVKIRGMLSETGLFVLTLEDPTTKTLLLPLEKVTEMTHPYMFTPETTRYLLDQAGLQVLGFADNLLDARRMRRHDYRKFTQENMRFLARRGEFGEAGVPKPDYRDSLERLRANQEAHRKYGTIINRWRNPTLLLRAWRKAWRTLGLW